MLRDKPQCPVFQRFGFRIASVGAVALAAVCLIAPGVFAAPKKAPVKAVKAKNVKKPPAVRSSQSIARSGRTVQRLTRKSVKAGRGSGGDNLTIRRNDKANINVCVLSLRPAFVTTEREATFETALALSNPRSVPVDALTVELYYQPEIIQPVSVDVDGLKEFTAKTPEVLADRAAGVITIRPDLAEPIAGSRETLVSIRWKGIRRSPGARVEFGPDTAVTSEGRDVLGSEFIPDDGMIGALVEVKPPSDPDMEDDELVYELEPHEIVLNLTREGSVNLRLYGPERSIKVGQEFYVDVWMDNLRQLPVDKVWLHLAFDPALLEVVDEDEENWVIRGVNVLDGPFKEKYPFDQHMINRAYNALGEIYYGVGAQEVRRLPRGGAFARIRFRALAEGEARVRFLMESDSSRFPTRVTYLGEDILGAIDNPEDGAEGCAISLIE